MYMKATLLTLLLLLSVPLHANNPHQQAIPEDSVAFYQSQTAGLLHYVSPLTQPFHLEALIDSLGADGPESQFLLDLIKQGSRILAAGESAASEQLGINTSGWLSAYHVGIMPLLRIELESAATLQQWIEHQAEITDYPLQTSSIDDARLYTLSLNSATLDNSDAQQWNLHIWVDQENAALGLAPSELPQTDLLARLSGLSIESSLASTDLVKQTAQEYGFEGSLGWLHLEQLAKTLVGAERNLLARELLLYTDNGQEQLGFIRNEICEVEWMNFISQSPRLVAGKRLALSDNSRLDETTGFIWELTNEELKTQLQQLQGSLPTDVGRLDRTLFSLGLGFNTDQLVPVLMNWWQTTVQQPWECPALIELREAVSQQNPAMLAVGTAILQSVDGLVIDLFDTGSDLLAAPQEMDLLIGIRSKNPLILASLLAQLLSPDKPLPMIAEGDPVVLQLPVEGWTTQARIKGDYLLLYQGAKAESWSEKIADSQHESTFLSASLDINATAKTLNGMQGITYGLKHEGEGLCMELEEGLDRTALFSDLNASLRLRTTDKGLSTIQRLRGTKLPLPEPLFIPGVYTVSLLDSGCIWQDYGQETLFADGRAELIKTDQDSSGTCPVFEGRSSWSLTGNQLNTHASVSRLRYGCDTGFSDWEEMADSQCHVVRVQSNSGFDCLVHGDELIRLRYTLQP
ncbi:hypothetical protein [Nitrincola sp. MINF-07-Sa-05]|uniref:hypothetical protein n=1 Tax=Nitrincola salilacus TaxID=3400273 RepID=UPI00391818CD